MFVQAGTGIWRSHSNGRFPTAEKAGSGFRIDDSDLIILVDLISYDIASTLALRADTANLATSTSRADSAIPCSPLDARADVVQGVTANIISHTLLLDRPVLWRAV